MTLAESFREEGKIKGRKEVKIEIAKQMIADDIPANKVALYTGLSLEEIYELQKEMGSTH